MADLWKFDRVIKIPLPRPKGDENKPPVLKIPHLEGWIMAGDNIYVPIIGGSGVAVADHPSGIFCSNRSGIFGL
jgi:protein NirF